MCHSESVIIQSQRPLRQTDISEEQHFARKCINCAPTCCKMPFVQAGNVAGKHFKCFHGDRKSSVICVIVSFEWKEFSSFSQNVSSNWVLNAKRFFDWKVSGFKWMVIVPRPFYKTTAVILGIKPVTFCLHYKKNTYERKKLNPYTRKDPVTSIVILIWILK